VRRECLWIACEAETAAVAVDHETDPAVIDAEDLVDLTRSFDDTPL
jgi:hypothetical protein